ncbi:MAG: succinylglutamate-semialdehyde dehydrogenase [Alphaproteobacteria bacterium]|nr:succinylglutamate-semialdehyde dehydrogenase [Alphaproteobacteria bacterium]MDE2041736.1 succinylglutamate-semialdehyde dehydrogenase [Alphaproteobacteria bacterium]MDE2339601.1 succinylglutamate-semialdehyde dehydrogenase [Alphaproteobacteria bacterium]
MSQNLQSIDPATGAVVWEGNSTSPEEVGAAVARARSAFPHWANAQLDERIAHIRAFNAELETRKDTIATDISRETGKALWETRAELASMMGKVDISISAQAERAGERSTAMPFGSAMLHHKPHGVMAVLGPYNFPGHLPNGHIVPALLAGNTVVFKPSEETPLTGQHMAEAWGAAGLPDGVFTLVQGGRETGAALIAQEIDGLLFTGSAGAGMHFRRAFADRPHAILALELGGNNPLIAWDGDVEEAASVIIQSSFITTGQRCSCARRVIVPDNSFGHAVMEAVAALAIRLVIGAWDEAPEPFMGPLISDRAATNARAQVGKLEALGARTILPFNAMAGRSAAFVTPALYDVTGLDTPDEEIFAPVIQLTRVTNFDAAIAAANHTCFGLSAGLITGDDALWSRFMRESRAGIVNRNRPTTGAAGSMPFGGLGDSGNHRPSAYYAADYCAYPVASFEAASAAGNAATIARLLQP